MRRIDLHVHSDRSDGTATPAKVVDLALAEGLDAIALTDHDTTEGVPEAREAAEGRGLEVLRGCEISTNLDGKSVHVLAYLPRDETGALSAFLDRVRRDRDDRNGRMLERLDALGVPLEWEDVRREAHGQVVARPHFARAMVRRGYVPDVQSAFDAYLSDSGPAYVVAGRPPPREAVRVVRESGGLPVIAHPRQIDLGDRPLWDAFLEDLVAAGLVGLEVDHPSHKPPHRRFFRDLARRHALVPTGGSDFHGDAKPGVRIGRGDGSVAIPYETWEALRQRGEETW